MTIHTEAPTTCPVCGDAKSHDVHHYETLALLGRHYLCGAAISIDPAGGWRFVLFCPVELGKLRAEVARLNAENQRIGDAHVLLAIETDAMTETAAEALAGRLDYARALRTIHDLGTEALAGNAPAAPGAAETVTVKAVLGSGAAARVADPARSS